MQSRCLTSTLTLLPGKEASSSHFFENGGQPAWDVVLDFEVVDYLRNGQTGSEVHDGVQFVDHILPEGKKVLFFSVQMRGVKHEFLNTLGRRKNKNKVRNLSR